MHPRPPGQSDGAAIPPEPPCSRHAISRTCFALGIRGTNPEQHQPLGTAVIALSTVELPDGPPAASSFGGIRALREPARRAWRSRSSARGRPGSDSGTGVPDRRPGYGAVARVLAPARIRRARLGPRDQPWPSGERPRPARRNRSGRCHGARSGGPCRLEPGRGDRSRGRSRTAPSCGRRRPLRQSNHRRSDAHHRGSRVRPGRSGARNGHAGGHPVSSKSLGPADRHEFWPQQASVVVFVGPATRRTHGCTRAAHVAKVGCEGDGDGQPDVWIDEQPEVRGADLDMLRAGRDTVDTCLPVHHPVVAAVDAGEGTYRPLGVERFGLAESDCWN
jgi:hypothetical protein